MPWLLDFWRRWKLLPARRWQQYNKDASSVHVLSQLLLVLRMAELLCCLTLRKQVALPDACAGALWVGAEVVVARHDVARQRLSSRHASRCTRRRWTDVTQVYRITVLEINLW